MANPYLQVSRDAARALEEFSDEFRGALVLGDSEPWASTLGYSRTSTSIKTTFPIPLDAAGYREFKGDAKYRSLYHRSLSMTTRQWQDGVEEFARILEAPDFGDWAGAPARMAAEWARLPNEICATMLALSALAGPLLDFYRDADSNTASTRRLFAADHPHNVFDSSLGTFDNRLTTTIAKIQSGEFFDDVNAHFRSIKGPNGKPLGLRSEGGTALVTPALDNTFKNVLQFDTIIKNIQEAGANVGGVTQNNIYKGTVSYVVADEFGAAFDDHFYFIAGGKPDLKPWVVQTSGTPEESILDKSSEHYIKTSKVSISYLGEAEVAACLPHPIVRVQITG